MKANEAELWKLVTVGYMTDESDKEDGTIAQHQLKRRSDGNYVYA